MLLRFSLGAAGALLLVAGANAQQTAKILPVPSVKHAGTYHVATGTWTRGKPSAAKADYQVIYDNTCQGAWYTSLEQQTFHDDGRIPSTTSPLVAQTPMPGSNFTTVSLEGTNDSYDIQQYEFAYCSGVAAPMTALNLFYECYTSCSDATLITPTAALQISGLPGSPTPGTAIGCWVVNIDLLGATLNFTMNGDCDGVWDGTPSLDNFGYAYMQSTPDPAAISGPILAGDPDGLLVDGPGGTGCCVGCGTVFWDGPGAPTGVPGTSTQGSGMANADNFEIDDHLGGYVFSFNGCYWFGGYSATAPHSDIHMEILGSATPAVTEPGFQYCDGKTASGNTCFCGNDNDGSNGAFAGCASSAGPGGAVLTATGVASVTAANDTLQFQVSGMEPLNSLMFFQALNNLDGAGIWLGDGMRCAGGALIRLRVKLADATGAADTAPSVISVRSAQLGDVLTAGDTRRYQVWGRDTNGSPCGTESMTSNGYELVWGM